MKLLTPVEFYKALRYQTLFFVILISSGIIFIPFSDLSTELKIEFAIIFLFLLILFLWQLYKGYKTKIILITESGLEDYLTKSGFTIMETFDKGWDHSIWMSGIFHGYPIELSLGAHEGIWKREYYLSVTALVENNVDKTLLKSQQKILSKNKIDVFKQLAFHREEIPLDNKIISSNKLQNLLIDLTDHLKFNSISPKMILQPLEQVDLPALANVQPSDWHDITPYFNYYISSPFCFPFQVILNGKIVGIGTTILHEDVAWLAHIIVSSEHRNKGIGSYITEQLVNCSKSLNSSTILLIATDLGVPVYEKIGFETDTEYLFFKDVKPFPLANTSDIHPFLPEYKNQLLKLDLETSGENRSMQLEAYLPEALVYKKNESIEGFYLPTLNEGLIVANNALAGIELIKYRAQTHDRISFPIENNTAREFLYQQGYKEFKTAKRMWLGTKRPWKPTQLYNRIGGNLG